jgi:hypothetical protein
LNVNKFDLAAFKKQIDAAFASMKTEWFELAARWDPRRF